MISYFNRIIYDRAWSSTSTLDSPSQTWMFTCRVESFTGVRRAGMFSTAQDQIRGGGLASPKGDSWSLTGQPFNPSSDILILGTAEGLCCGNGQPAVIQGMVWRYTTILYSLWWSKTVRIAFSIQIQYLLFYLKIRAYSILLNSGHPYITP